MTADHAQQLIRLKADAEVSLYHSVILVHGLMRNSKSLRRLGQFLCRQGFDVYLYDYQSTRFGIAEHAETLLKHVECLLGELSTGTSMSFITHSLGGIISREVLSRLHSNNNVKIRNLIMLAPPNQGSTLAKTMTKRLPLVAKRIKPLAELSTDSNAYVHFVPIPKNIQIVIIAATFDMKTPPASTVIDCKHDFVQVNSTHTFIMNHPKTRKMIIHYLNQDQ